MAYAVGPASLLDCLPGFTTAIGGLNWKLGSGQVMCAVPLSEDAAPISFGRLHMKLNKGKTWIVGTTAILGAFGVLCAHFDPIVAFALSLVVFAAVKN